jgi:hypothetical protein
MYGNALSQTVDSDRNGWPKTSARDAPGGAYAAVTGVIRVSGGPTGSLRQESESLLGWSAKHKLEISCTVCRGFTLGSRFLTNKNVTCLPVVKAQRAVTGKTGVLVDNPARPAAVLPVPIRVPVRPFGP